MITQKVIGYHGDASTEVDYNKMENGQRAGLFCIGNLFNAVGVVNDNDKYYLYSESDGKTNNILPLSSGKVYFKASLDAVKNQHQLFYSLDNKEFIPVGEPYALRSSDWKGAHVGIFSYNTLSDGGVADFNWFRYKFDGPGLYADK